MSDLADEIVATSKSNRQLLQAIVANEVEGAVARLGFVRSEEVAALTRRVDGLERELAERTTRWRRYGRSPLRRLPVPLREEGREEGRAGEEGSAAPRRRRPRRLLAKKAAAKKAAAKKAAKKAPAKKA